MKADDPVHVPIQARAVQHHHRRLLDSLGRRAWLAARRGLGVVQRPLNDHLGAGMLFKKRGLNFTDIPIVDDEDARAEMQRRSGASSVPQIFINDQPIGGFDELYELQESGDLDKLLGTCADVAGN